jgi:hypothetical protein
MGEMNMLPKEAIEEFKQIYERNFREKLSDEEIFRRAIKLLNLYKAVYGFPSLGEKEIKEKQNKRDVENNR